MAYKYFTQKLLSSDLNLADVFPEQQDDARVQVNASYSLFDIAQFLQDRTDNFNKTEQQYIDLDSAISEIISKWYKSTGKENPFIEKGLDDEEVKPPTTPRESAIVDDGKLKSKGAPKAAPDVQKKSAKAEDPRIVKFKKELADRKEIFDDVYDDAEKADFIQLMQDKLDVDSDFADEGEEYFVQRVAILKDFIKQLKK